MGRSSGAKGLPGARAGVLETRVRTGLIVVGATLTLLALARWALRRGLTPSAEVPPDDPAARGLLGVQTVWLDAPRGRRLFAWFAPAQGVARAPPVVLMRGWGSHAGPMLQAAVALQRAGFAVLLPEARNHGRSDRTVPLDDVEQLYARRGTAAVRLLLVEGTHEQFDDEPALFDAVQAFLHERLVGRPCASAHNAGGIAQRPAAQAAFCCTSPQRR
ncbi:MAG: alpha/beta hydrolase [Tepidimonas sp.]|uniref:alpha/beta hydrolase n=1 Tax=Tepidimonas sp. TaxID=2002775 RepID=UPI004054C129